MKTCSKCQMELHLEQFSKRKRTKDGLKNQCKACDKKYNEEHKEYRKKYYEERKEAINEQQKKYYEKNKEVIREYKKKYHKENRKK